MDTNAKQSARDKARQALDAPPPPSPSPSSPTPKPPENGTPKVIIASIAGALITLVLLGIVGFAEKFGGLTLAGATIAGGAISGAVTAFLRDNDKN